MGEEPEKVAVEEEKAVEEPKENGVEEKVEEEKPTEKIKKAPKPVKKSIPTWATLSDDDKKKLSEKVKVKIDSNKELYKERVSDMAKDADKERCTSCCSK